MAAPGSRFIVSLAPIDKTSSEEERDARRAVGWMLGYRGFHRRGDILTIPITVGYMRKALRKTEARRTGRDSARDILALCVELGLLEDTGEVLKPRRQPSGEHQYWWRLWKVIPVIRALHEAQPQYGAYGPSSYPGGGLPLQGSLCRFLARQGLIRRRRRARPGSVQWAFQNSGPP